MPSMVARAIEMLHELGRNWPMARKWIHILQRSSAAAAVDQVARADVAGDTATGVLAHNSFDYPLSLPPTTVAGSSHGSVQVAPPLSPGPIDIAPPPLRQPGLVPHPNAQYASMPHSWSHPSADGLHTLAMAAAKHPAPADPYTAAEMYIHPMMQYVDMPFGDPTQQHSFHDVLAYMNGEPR
jgi:hypothetical protein